MIIRIAFCKEENTWHHKIIKWWTDSIYSHAELVFPDDTSVSISPFETIGVRRQDKYDFDDTKCWDMIEVEISEDQADKLQDFFLCTEGDQYDWLGMVLSQFTPFIVKRIGRWYCSEWIAYALRIISAIDGVYIHADLSPQRLFELLKRKKEVSSSTAHLGE